MYIFTALFLDSNNLSAHICFGRHTINNVTVHHIDLDQIKAKTSGFHSLHGLKLSNLPIAKFLSGFHVEANTSFQFLCTCRSHKTSSYLLLALITHFSVIVADRTYTFHMKLLPYSVFIKIQLQYLVWNRVVEIISAFFSGINSSWSSFQLF